MDGRDYYIFDFPITVTTKRGNGMKPQKIQSELFFMHGNGCDDWTNCLTCPKDACNWQPCSKKRNKIKGNGN